MMSHGHQLGTEVPDWRWGCRPPYLHVTARQIVDGLAGRLRCRYLVLDACFIELDVARILAELDVENQITVWACVVGDYQGISALSGLIEGLHDGTLGRANEVGPWNGDARPLYKRASIHAAAPLH